MSDVVFLALESTGVQLRRAIADQIQRVPTDRKTQDDWHQIKSTHETLEFLRQRGSAIYGARFTPSVQRLVEELKDAAASCHAVVKPTERCTYRILDSIGVLLSDLGIDEPGGIAVFRRESLRKLYRGVQPRHDWIMWRSAALTFSYLVSAVLVAAATVQYVEAPTSWWIATTTTAVFCRLAYLAASRKDGSITAKHRCATCGAQSGSAVCRTCHQSTAIAFSSPATTKSY